MNSTTMLPSNYLKAADLQGRSVKVAINIVVIETIGEGKDAKEKPVIYFSDAKKGLVLNRINTSRIEDSYGEETDDWSGKTVEIYPDTTDFKGKMVDCVRVRVPSAEPQPAAAEGEVPF